ncbi:MAG: NAD(P)H-dependent glycerol-3-phosphate dehydrogenase [Candidatus Caenarcaniphilales bacterium]|nr:NAD(P)H-dependent glycerol-3-phosphate dehydrogenase [Candidatus Caenarcaniphilales bacterium]
MKSSDKITVLGAGSWGTVLTQILACGDYQIGLWDRSTRLVEEVKAQNCFTRPIHMPLLENIQITDSLEEALEGNSLVVCAIPSEGVEEVIERIQKTKSPKIDFLLSTTKGLDQKTGKTMSQIWREYDPELQIAVLSGPNLSAEAALSKPMRTVIGSESIEKAQKAAAFFQKPGFVIEITSDMIGLEICGAVKNVIALAAGAWDGFELGISGKGSLLTKSISELTDLVVMIGGGAKTVYSVGGLGDLFITCSSKLSRNYYTGYALARGRSLGQIQQELRGQVAEGVWTAPLLHRLATEYQCEFRICEMVYQMLQSDLTDQDKRSAFIESYQAMV